MWRATMIRASIADLADTVDIPKSGYPRTQIIALGLSPPVAPRASHPTISVGPHGTMVEDGGMGEVHKHYMYDRR